MKHEKLQIILKHGEPDGIRDRGGYLFFFPTPVIKYPGQEQRYRDDLERRFNLADYLLDALKARTKKAPSEDEAL